jgi:glycosyltransferase involved in cell wall biosynthesis
MAARPKICFVSMEVYPNLVPGVSPEAGGAGFQLVEIARGLRDEGFPVSFVVGDYDQAFHQKIDGFDVYRANKVAYNRSIRRSVKNLWRLFKAMRAARCRHYVLRSTRFLSFFVMFFARLLGGKYTFMVASLPHCLREELEELPNIFRRLYLVSIKFAHRVTVQTSEQQRLFEENFGLRAPIVPNGIETPPFEPDRPRPAFDVCWVASFKSVKRADILIEIARRLPHLKFLVVGGPGPDPAYSQKLIDELQTMTNVEFRGFVPPDQVGPVYTQARIFLNTSDWEGFPNGYLYAWSRGIPVGSLTIDPDGVVTGKELGVVVDDVDELCRRVDQLLGDDIAYRAMARRCYDHVVATHSRASTVQSFVSILP